MHGMVPSTPVRSVHLTQPRTQHQHWNPLFCPPPGLTLTPSGVYSLRLPRGLKTTRTGREPSTVVFLLSQGKVGQPETELQRKRMCCSLRKQVGLGSGELLIPGDCFCPTGLIDRPCGESCSYWHIPSRSPTCCSKRQVLTMAPGTFQAQFW